ncbi:hypothetical protein NE237_020276 [Protea cynaroides]|uniref:J domain-containing protein n=1 Tax=Protea cynaroides TaxID=273540 RepID=A0A9Q0H5N6_9MAGN|nr:hypothetical protein NE237_020276 [Protea cynaroides]
MQLGKVGFFEVSSSTVGGGDFLKTLAFHQGAWNYEIEYFASTILNFDENIAFYNNYSLVESVALMRPKVSFPSYLSNTLIDGLLEEGVGSIQDKAIKLLQELVSFFSLLNHFSLPQLPKVRRREASQLLQVIYHVKITGVEQRMSKGQSQPGTHTTGRTLERCKEKVKTNAVVYIDIDTEDLSDVVVIDAPSSSQQRGHGSNVSRNEKSYPSGNIISIDDDDESPGTDRKSSGDLDSDATSSRASRFEPRRSQNSEELDGEDCQLIQERKFSVKLSKCKRTYSGKTIPRNRYAFSSDSEDESSESDSSDCELMDGSFGKIRDQWEKAFSKKKTSDNARSSQSVVDEQGCGSGSISDNQKNVEVENESEQQNETPVRSGSSDLNDAKENVSSYSERKYDLRGRGPFSFSQEEVDEQFNYESAFFHDKVENVSAEPSWLKNQSGYDPQSNHRKCSFQGKEDSSCDTHPSVQTQADQDREFYLGKNERIHQETSCCDAQLPNDTKNEIPSFEDEEEPDSGEQSFCDSQPCLGKPTSHGSEDSKVHTPVEALFNSRLWDDPGINHDRFICPNKAKSVSDKATLRNTQQDGTLDEDRRCFRNGAEPNTESLAETKLQDEKNPVLHALDGYCMSDVRNEIISEREKIKETDEYKRAVEEEWASRQRELQIQAEEARRLKKRKKAEMLRLLDMERRQKRRVEEMRESQKKDEETINLKEQLRMEIRKELDRLESMYSDMASLLRALGIHVGGGHSPMPHEVHAAYRRALLKFHPDRASRTDNRQQVEAEEKFKLISRLKEKFLPTL